MAKLLKQSKPQRRRDTIVGLASVEVQIRMPNGMRLRLTTKVGSAEAMELWAMLHGDEAAPEAPRPVQPAEVR